MSKFDYYQKRVEPVLTTLISLAKKGGIAGFVALDAPSEAEPNQLIATHWGDADGEVPDMIMGILAAAVQQDRRGIREFLKENMTAEEFDQAMKTLESMPPKSKP